MPILFRAITPWFLGIVAFIVAEAAAAQSLKIEAPFGEDLPPYASHRVLLKLRDGAVHENIFIPYNQRAAKHESLLGRIKVKYGLRDHEPVFKGLHGELAQGNLSVAAHAQQRETGATAQGKKSMEGKPVQDLVPFYALETEEADLPKLAAQLSRDPDIEFAQPDYLRKLTLSSDDLHGPEQWGSAKIQSLTANDSSLGEGVIVAVVDSGIDYTHEDLRDNMWVNPGEVPGDGSDNDGDSYVDDVRGYNFIDNNADISDDYMHGTFEAGIIAAVLNNGIGIYGTAPRARLMAVKAADATGAIYSSTAAAGIQYAADRGADVINNAYGPTTATPSDPVIEAAVTYAYNAGAVVVFAAGNDGVDVANYSPQNMAIALTVGATDESDKRPYWSNYGARVDVSAPGANIISSLSTTIYGVAYHNMSEQKYLSAAGTSASAAYVSGLAALVLAKNKNLTPAQVETYLKNGGDTITTDQPIGKRINAAATLGGVPAVDHAAITSVAFDGDQISFSGILRRASVTSCQPAWKKSNSATWTSLASVTPPAVGQEFPAGMINVAAIGSGVINLRLACGTLSHETSYHIDRILNPCFFDKSAQRVNLLGNDLYYLNIARLAGTTWSSLALEYQKDGSTTWQSNGATLFVPPGVDRRDSLLFTFDSSAMPSSGQYTFRLTAQAAGAGTPYTVSKTFRITVDTSTARGWPAFTRGAVVAQQPTIVDLDGDGDREICIDTPSWGGGGQQGLQVIHHDGVESQTLQYFFGERLGVGLSAANLDGVAGREMVYPDSNTLHVAKPVNGYFTDLPGWPLIRPWYEIWSGAPAPLIADLNFDGLLELVTVTTRDNSSLLGLYDKDGTKRFEVMLPLTSFAIDALAVIDLDSDFQKEIIVTTQESDTANPKLRAYRYNGFEYAGAGWPVDLKLLSQRSGSLSQYNALALLTGDVDGDLDDELVLTNQLNELFVLEKNGVLKAGFPKYLQTSSGSPVAMIALGDIDTFPGAEIVVPNGNNLDVLRSDGTQPAGWPQTLSSLFPGYQGYQLDAPVIADIDGDGLQEILTVAVMSNYFPLRPVPSLIAWKNTGAMLRQWPTYGYVISPHTPGPSVLDIDKDGVLELVQPSQMRNISGAGMSMELDTMLARVFVWKLTGSSTYGQMDWPVFKANSRRTSEYIRYGDVSGDGQVSAYDASRTAQAAIGMTTFKSEQRQRGDVSGDGQITAYDAALIARKAVGLLDRFVVEE